MQMALLEYELLELFGNIGPVLYTISTGVELSHE